LITYALCLVFVFVFFVSATVTQLTTGLLQRVEDKQKPASYAQLLITHPQETKVS
jgi:hypothetical protein